MPKGGPRDVILRGPRRHKAKSGGGKGIIQPFIEGMADLGRESGLKAIEDVPNSISDLFGAGGGGKGKSGGGHH